MKKEYFCPHCGVALTISVNLKGVSRTIPKTVHCPECLKLHRLKFELDVNVKVAKVIEEDFK